MRRFHRALLVLIVLELGRPSALFARPRGAEVRDAAPPTADERAKDPKTVLEIKPRQAGSPTLLTGSAKPFLEAKKLLGRGKPALALKALSKSDGVLLGDREALLRGDALLALGDRENAKKAYLDAIEKSQVSTVSTAAARGLVNVLGLLKDHEGQLLYLDALLTDPAAVRKPNLLLQRALILRDMGRQGEAADIAFKIVSDFPSSKVSAQAGQLVEELTGRGVKTPALTNTRIEITHVRTLIASGEFKRAEAEMARIEKAKPSLKHALDLERVEMFKRRKMKAEEFDLLLELYNAGELNADESAKMLARLGHLSMSRDDNEGAVKFFDELAEKYPNAPETDDAQYLAGWIPYNAGDYDRASERLLRFAATYKKSPSRAEALWYAGWSAYLSTKDGLARRAFEQLLEEHPTSDLRPQARYWIGRIRQRAGDETAARAAYREVLAQSPLSYWGFWSIARLDELGEKTVLDPPPPTSMSPMSKVIAMLGPTRPIGIDRAIALHAVDLTNEALEELTEANAYLKAIKDTAGRTMIADLLQTLGAHYLAFRVGSSIAQDGGDLVTGKPYAWRAWRHAYPEAFEKEVSLASNANEIDGHLILSIMRTESSFRVNIRSPVGAQGLMQLMPGTAMQIGRATKDGRAHAARYKQPESNVWLGSWYLARLIKRYGGQIAPAIGAYNAGPGAMDKWVSDHGGLDLDEFVERVPYRETRRYIRRVLETYLIYRRLAGDPLLDLRGKVRDLMVPEESVAF